MPIYLIILFVILSVYFFIGAGFLLFLKHQWLKNGDYKYQLLVEQFRDVPILALKFGATWILTFTHLVLHYALVRGSTFKERFLEAAANHADEVINAKPDDDGAF